MVQREICWEFFLLQKLYPYQVHVEQDATK